MKMETKTPPLFVLSDSGSTVIEKPESNPSPTFITSSGWLTTDFNIDAETILSTSKSKSSLRNHFQLVEWGPQKGNSESAISVILEQVSMEHQIGAIKIIFGQLPLATTHHTYCLPSMDRSLERDSVCPTTIWITLAAKVPEDRPISNQVLISVYFYDNDYHDMVIDSREIGTFTLTESFDGTVDDKQLLEGLASSDDSQTRSKQHRGSLLTSTDCVRIPQQSDQSYLFENMNAMDTFYMNNLSSNYLYGSSVDNTCKQYRQPDTSYNNVIEVNMEQRQNYSSCNSMFSNGERQYDGYQPGRMTSQSNNNNHNYIYTPRNDNLQHSRTSNQTNSNSCYYGNHFNSNSSNTPSYTETKAQPAYNVITSHPFVSLLNKSNLKICGDLMQMTFQWSSSEWQKGRRLVRFWRRQNTGNIENIQQVECGFESIEYYNHQQEQQQQLLRMNDLAAALDQLPSGSLHAPISPGNTRPFFNNQSMDKTRNSKNKSTTSLVVSCIYWKERNDYFITSVDCIYLLEGLIGVQFTVEEKNRIRRNLEGFHPLTVSKCKTGSADFFKLIMGFPHPKPRNIEKDVKVFAWKTLPHALRKIIRKYTPIDTNSSSVLDCQHNYQYLRPPSSIPGPPQIINQPGLSSHVHQQHPPLEHQYCY